MSHIFLSYSEADSEFARKLYNDLQEQNLHVWKYDFRNRVGDDWVKNINEALTDSIGIIALFSENFINSKFCPQELNVAIQRKIPVFPIVISPIDIKSLPAHWQRYIILDIQQKGYPVGLSELLKSIRKENVFVPIPKSTIYIGRKNQYAGSDNIFGVYVDGSEVVKLEKDRAKIFTILPGTHSIKIEFTQFHFNANTQYGESEILKQNFTRDAEYYFETGYEEGIVNWFRWTHKLTIRQIDGHEFFKKYRRYL